MDGPRADDPISISELNKAADVVEERRYEARHSMARHGAAAGRLYLCKKRRLRSVGLAHVAATLCAYASVR